MSGTAEHTVDSVTADLVLLACAGIKDRDLREGTAKRVRELTDEGCRLAREDERRKARKSLGRAWSAWLDLMMTTGLPDGTSLLEEVLYFEPELRARLAEAFLGERHA